MSRKSAQFECMECGHLFYTTRSAERASVMGCPECNGVDVDLPRSEYDRAFPNLERTDIENGEDLAAWEDNLLAFYTMTNLDLI
jgi:predicted  nucleic acid-binding Zn-ribbon protein